MLSILLRKPLLSTLLIFFVNIVMIIFLVIAGGKEYWIHINFESSHLTWFSSVQLLAISFVAWGIADIKQITQKEATFAQKIFWYFIAFAFLFFSLDEKFQIHERLREGVFKPNHIGTSIPFIGAGDFLHLIFAFIGLFVAYGIWKQLGTNASKILLVAAVGFSLFSVISDAVSPIPSIPISQEVLQSFRLHQFTEEIGETFSEACFLASFALYFLSLLPRILSKDFL